MHSMITAATFLLLGFAVLAAVDGIYLHLWKLRLHTRPASWLEHLLHTASAVVFVPILLTLFLAPTAGPVLWSALALLVLLHAIEVLDVRVERASRAELGGLSRGELALHVVLVGTRSLAVLLTLASRPLAAWSPFAPPTLGEHPAWVGAVVGVGLVPGAVAVAAIHLVTAWRHRPLVRRQAAA